MKIMAISRSYDQRGAAPISYVARYLERFLASVDPVDLMIEVESFHVSIEPVRPTLEPLSHRFDVEYARLPRLRHLRKANKITLDYASTLRSDVAHAYGNPKPETFRALFVELCGAIETVFSSSRSLQTAIAMAHLLNALVQAADRLPHDDEAIARLIDEISAEWAAERLQPMTMDRLPVEWHRFHPNARALLNDPFFWDEVDDDAPHGNDTGSDLLAAFQRWRPRNQTADPVTFLDKTLKQWGFSCAPPDDPVVLEAEIGLAFAQIKLEGWCDPAVAARALNAIDRRLFDVANEPVRVTRFRSLKDAVLALSGARGIQ